VRLVDLSRLVALRISTPVRPIGSIISAVPIAAFPIERARDDANSGRRLIFTSCYGMGCGLESDREATVRVNGSPNRMSA
jgi:hypothetical protein